MKSICVFCASSRGNHEIYAQSAQYLGKAIAARGCTLVYGGSRAGLMGITADAALASGAEVIGIIPRFLGEREAAHLGLTELHIVETMHQRKQLMAEHSDAFVILPGGMGTMEEFFEVWTWAVLELHHKPIGILNIAGYYDSLRVFLNQAVQAGLLAASSLAKLHWSEDIDALLDTLAAAQSATGAEIDLSKS